MLFETLFQPKIIAILCIFGFLSGFLYDLARLVNLVFERNKHTYQILLFLSTILCFFIFTKVCLWCNYGRLRFYAFLIFFGSLFLQRIMSHHITKHFNFYTKKRKG